MPLMMPTTWLVSGSMMCRLSPALLVGIIRTVAAVRGREQRRAKIDARMLSSVCSARDEVKPCDVRGRVCAPLQHYSLAFCKCGIRQVSDGAPELQMESPGSKPGRSLASRK